MRSPVKIILLLVLIWALPFLASAQFSFFTNNGSITITGGFVTNGNIQIPGTLNGLAVTTIGTNAFVNSVYNNNYNYLGVTNLFLPNSIGSYAFAGCPRLTNIVVDSKNAAYSSTNGVLFNQKKSALLLYPAGKAGGYVVPSGVTTIAQDAFSSCPNLASLDISSSVTNVADGSLLISSGLIRGRPAPPGQFSGQAVFTYCTGLTNISVDPLNANYSSFDGVLIDKLKSRLIQCPQGKIGSFIVPTNVIRLGTNCFSSCSQLSQVTVTNTVVRIEDGAFGGCSGLTSMTIPGSVIEIGAQGFAYCYGLTNLVLTTNLAIIGDSAFYGCESLSGITVPRSVTNLVGSAFSTFGSGPHVIGFGHAYGLTNITVDALNPSYSSLSGMLFDKNQTILIKCPFGKTAGFDLPVTVTNIGIDAFDGCLNLTNLALPPNVVTIGSNAFNACFGLVNLALPGGLKRIDTGAFGGCYNLSTIVVPSGVKNIADFTFEFCANLVNVTLPNTVTNIGLAAFTGCGMTNFTLPSGLITLGYSSFYSCPNLASINIPAGVTNLGLDVFSRCSSLTNISVDALNLFYGTFGGVLFDKGLKQIITYPAGKIGDGNYSIPDGVTNVADSAFDSCSGLTNITVPASVVSLGLDAFSGCSSLTGIYFRGNAPGLGPFAFPDFLFGFGNVPAIAYYLPGTTGWTTNYGGFTTAIWPPAPQTTDASFGIRTNRFGFNVVWSTGQKVVMEASTNLASGSWQPIQTNTLVTNSWYFSDPQWTNNPRRYYRIRSP